MALEYGAIVNFKKLAVLLSAAVAGASAAANAAAQAEWKPQRPIEIVVPVTAGGGIDRPARVLQQIWTEGRMVSVPVNVSNKPGGGQSVGLNYVHQAPGDAHRFVLMSSPLLTNAIVGNSKLHYTDFTILGPVRFFLYRQVRSRLASLGVDPGFHESQVLDRMESEQVP